jgi:hypothetical protein
MSVPVPAQAGGPGTRAASVSPALLLAALDTTTEAIVVCAARDHSILVVNAAARALMPGLADGLARAAAAGRETFTGEYAGRRLSGRRRRLDDSHYGWFLHDRDEETAGAMAGPLPQPDGIELTASYRPATGTPAIGGDFYDVFGPATGSDDTVVVLGDVCGRGPEAAALTGQVRQTLRALRLVEAAPAEMLVVLNQALLQSGRRHRYVTLVIGSIERAEHGRVRLTLAAGGHPAPLVVRGDGTVEEVPASGTLIGVVRETIVQPATVELAPGELCLLFSNGLTEARGGPTGTEPYGDARLHDALSSCRGVPGAALVDRVNALVSDWAGEGLRDDIAMLAVRAPSRTPLSLRGGGAAPGSPFAINARRGDRRPRQRQ